jgi:membrane associated rhomboid family serine protease
VALGALAYLAPPAWSRISGVLIDDVARVAAGEVWRIVTAALLHAPRSLFHIGFNMYALYAFGPQLERRFGSGPFLLFYLASAAAGGLAFQVVNESGRALGASGAIFGLFGAYVTSAYLSRHTPAGRAGLNQLVPLLLLNLALPLLIPGIAWEAHLGGLVAGAVMALVWRRIADAADGARPRLVRGSVAAAVLLFSLVAAAVV